MGRKAALTEKQWKDIEERFYKGESASSLAREYGISEGAIRKRFGAKREKAKELANQIVAFKEVEEQYELGTKILARTYADKIIAMRELSADVAINGLKVAKRYGDILVKRIDTNKDDDLMNDEAISQAAKVGTVINIHNKPANDAMAIASRQQSEPESTEITITGGMDMLPVPYDHPPRNRSEEDI